VIAALELRRDYYYNNKKSYLLVAVGTCKGIESLRFSDFLGDYINFILLAVAL